MSRLALSAILSPNERSRPLIEGSVRPEAIDLTVSTGHASEIFWRQLRFAEFDVSDMSLSSCIISVARGDRTWVGLPVFTTRRFFHTMGLVRADAGIERPEQLRGRRVGVPEYQQTAALWARGILQHEHGVAATEIDWFMERGEAGSHGGATGFTPPPGVRLQHIPPEQSIASMLIDGTLDAALVYVPENNLVDRSGSDFLRHPRVRTLFPDNAAEGRRYYAATGIFPMSHCIVVRRTVLDAHPWAALNLYKAFVAAKEAMRRQLRELSAVYVQLGLLDDAARRALAQDPYPYGVAANRLALETITRYSHEQGLTARVVGLNELFAPSTLAL